MPAHRRWRRRLALATLLVLVAALVVLVSRPASWAEVDLDVRADRVAFTLTKPRPLVDSLPLEELAVLDLASVRHPDPATGGDRLLTADTVGSEYLGFLATSSEGDRGALSLDSASLPAGTRIDLESVPPDALRLSLDFTHVDSPGVAREVTASLGEGVITFRILRQPSEPFDLVSGGRLVMTPRDDRIELDLTPAGSGTAEPGRFHTPLDVGDLRLVEASFTEERGTWATEAKQVSTVRSGTVVLEPLGGGKPKTIQLGEREKIAFENLRGEITRLTLDGESLSVGFRGRAGEVIRRTGDDRTENLIPPWGRTPWALRLGAATIALLLLLVLFDRLGTFLRSVAGDRRGVAR
jgi:hypothetical protein